MLGLGIAGAPNARGAAPSGPEKFTLVYKADAGQTVRLKGEAVLNAEIRGNKLVFDEKDVSKTTYTKVAPSGDITFEQLTEDAQVSINGRPVPPGDEKHEPDTLTIHPDGTLAAYKEGSATKDEDHVNARLYVATSPVFPKKAVGVGDKWSYDYPESADLGLKRAHADFEVVGQENVKGADTLKIQMTYAENGTGQNIAGKGTIWVEKASGDTVREECQVEGVPFPAGPDDKTTASGTMTEERVEGGPLVASGKASDAPVKKDKTIDDTVKDFEKVPGFVTLYRKKEAGKDTLYAELREDQVGKLMLLQATASTGTAQQVVAGDPINDLVFKFVRTPDDRIVMDVPNFSYRADPNSPTGRSVSRSFADTPIQSFKIEAKQPDRKSLLIDVSDLFKGDVAQISQALNPPIGFGMGGGGGFAIDREKTYLSVVKNFPDNLVVSTAYSFLRAGARSPLGMDATLADPRGAAVTITYNLFALPNDPVTYAPTNGYTPRLYDPRVGYFTGSENLGPNFQSFDDDSKEDPYVYYITRWDLKKKDPNAALSEPVKPIVFWIDNAVPLEYRDAVRDGLLVWNKAFEKVGFKDAVVVKQMPDNPDPKDPNVPTDTADMRFNTIRWVTSPASGYAVALFRANPLTGQMLNASITVDAGIVHFEKLSQQDFVAPAEAFQNGAGVGVEQQLLERRAQVDAAVKAGIPVSPLAPAQRALFGTDPRYCQFGAGEREQAWFGDMALSALAPDGFTPADRKAYIYQYLRHVVSHEMGHIMGLRHNFAASTEFSMAQLGDPNVTATRGVVASVMDYTPFNIAAIRKKGVPYYPPSLGAYDYWAIQYGYMSVPNAKTPDDETSTLSQVASLSGLPGHAYASDESADDFDPMVTRFDLSSDPLAYWQKNLDVSRFLLVGLDKRLPKKGQSYWEFTRAFDHLLGLYSYSAGVASRYVGGLNYSRTHKGDPGERSPLSPVDVAKQKQALALLNTYIFSPDAMRFPLSYYTKLTTNPRDLSLGDDFPIQDEIAGVQRAALRRLFSGSVLDRVANNEFKMGGDPSKALRLADLFRSVSANVWSEVDAHQNVPTLRRQLQRAYVDTMVNMVTKPGGVPEDARMLAWDQLRQLRTRLAAAQQAHPAVAYDTYTRIHLEETLAKVNRALAASITFGGGSSSGPSLLQMLLGGDVKPAAAAASSAAPAGN